MYDIENRIYRYRNNNLDTELSLTDVQGFERVPSVVHTKSDKRQFVIDRPNIANNFDYSIPLGISVFANAVDVLIGVDKAYNCYANAVRTHGAFLIPILSEKTLKPKRQRSRETQNKTEKS